ncbi:YfiR family protein [Nostoc ellipsosporum NOK]|nr:YfiR family protein [Nostoc ellipsosporum NOK]
MLLALALSAIVPGSAEVPILAAETRFAPGTEDSAVARTIGGIASYSRWPEPTPTLHVCVAGAVHHADRLGEAARTAGRPVTVRRLGVGTAPGGCDLLYLGAMRPAESLGMIRATHGRAILSIAESDPACRGGAMFCLVVGASSIGFRINIDAISRSALRVDPRVQRVATLTGGGN